jgi:hypothetical protein
MDYFPNFKINCDQIILNSFNNLKITHLKLCRSTEKSCQKRGCCQKLEEEPIESDQGTKNKCDPGPSKVEN